VIRVSTLRFFEVVAPVPRHVQIALAASAALGAWMVWLNPRDADSALGSVLLLQMFAVSNGYASTARRGWFDPLLVSGRGRAAQAYANLAASALPGLVVWLFIAMLELFRGSGAWPAALTAQRIAALSIVTTGAWAAGVMLPRHASGMLWLAILLVLASSRGLLPELTAMQTAPDGIRQTVSYALACIVCPFLLLADTAAVRHPAIAAIVLTAAGACAMGGATWISNREWPLVVAR
jgi:hypothetical protein